jgi:hypothetical protein
MYLLDDLQHNAMYYFSMLALSEQLPSEGKVFDVVTTGETMR